MDLAMPFYHPKSSTSKLHGKALVVPVVSTANVSQLAADLLIASLGLRCIGLFDPRDIVPVVGGRDDGEEGVTTPLELYGSDASSVVVIQQRSPALKARKQEFIDSLLKFIEESQFSAILFLSGVDSSNRTDEQMQYAYYLFTITTLSTYSYPSPQRTNLPHPPPTKPLLHLHAALH
ncbi:hypothetical protein EVG20_g10928, partial [Dentipellis fragilis]